MPNEKTIALAREPNYAALTTLFPDEDPQAQLGVGRHRSGSS